MDIVVANSAFISFAGLAPPAGGDIVPPSVVKNATAIIVADNETEAVRLANDSEYGLGASIWTQDLDKAEKLSRLVRAGMLTVNNVVFSDPRVPFGGLKHSGFGRECSKFSMLEFVNIKSIRFYDELVHHHYVE